MDIAGIHHFVNRNRSQKLFEYELNKMSRLGNIFGSDWDIPHINSKEYVK